MKYLTIAQATNRALSFFNSLKVGELEKIEIADAYAEANTPTGKYENVSFFITYREADRRTNCRRFCAILTVTPYATDEPTIEIEYEL